MNSTDRKTNRKPNLARLLAAFNRLISFDSPSFGEREICDFLKSRLSALGAEVHESAPVQSPRGRSPQKEQHAKAHENTPEQKTGNSLEKDILTESIPEKDNTQEKSCGNLYGYLPGTPDLPPLLLSAHMDTVEPSHGKQMVTDAEGRITSAGSTVLGADDCAGLASILEALTVIFENQIPHRPVEILFTAAEEPYCAGAGQFDFSKLQSKEAYVFDLTGPVGGAAYQAPTIVSFTIRFCGRSAHAGFEPENGIHAIKAAALAVTRIPCGHVGSVLRENSSGGNITLQSSAGTEKADSSTINIGTISGGTADNIVPDTCTVSGEIRSYSDAEAQGWLREITAVAEQCAKSMGASAEVQHTTHFHAYCTDLSHPVVRRFESACEQLKLPLNLCRTFGGSDNNHLAYHGITGLVVATAMNNCHSCEEYTTIDELERAANLALALILS